MDFVSGEILTVDGLSKGYIGFDNRKIVETGKGISPKKPICKGLIVPYFVNAHTHIGDSFIRGKNIDLPKNVEELVGPPDGLKHRLLRESSDKDIIKGMEKSIEIMIKNGTGFFCDFRENGILGIDQLKTALNNWKISCFILSRPDKLIYNKDEINNLLKKSDGVGISSISDWEESELRKLANHTKNENKIFGIHASERIREDIDTILDLKPDFLVHMIKATESDLICVKDNKIPIIFCPKSNNYFGLKPNYKLIEKTGVDFILGTDNAMLNPPNILDELKFFQDQSKIFSKFDLLNKIIYGARKVLNLECDILGPNSPADFVVLDKQSLNILYVSAYK